MEIPSQPSNKIILILLALFVVLYYLFLWFPFYVPYLLIGSTNTGLLVGYLTRLLAVVILYLLYVRHIDNKPTTRVMPEESKRIHFRVIDLIVFVLIYNISPNILDFLYNLFFDPSYNNPGRVDRDFYIDYLSAVFVAPFVEEIIFRWLFFKIVDRFDLGKYDFLGKMTLNVSIFALIHYGTNFTEIINYSTYLISIPLWSLFGFMAFLVYYHTRSLRMVILLHMLTNWFVMTVRWIHLVAEDQGSDFRIESWWIAALLVILILLFYRKNLRSISEIIIKGVFSMQFLLFVLFNLLFTILVWAITYPLFYYFFDTNIILLGIYMLIAFPLYSLGLIKVMRSDDMVMVSF